jgi:hypothetical protein
VEYACHCSAFGGAVALMGARCLWLRVARLPHAFQDLNPRNRRLKSAEEHG